MKIIDLNDAQFWIGVIVGALIVMVINYIF